MKISFTESSHPSLDLENDAVLSEHLTIENSPVLFGCRTGICGTCLIEVSTDDVTLLPKPNDSERELLSIIAEGNPRARLACQLRACGSLKIKYLGPA